MWHIKYDRQALKDYEGMRDKHLKDKAKEFIEILKSDPYKLPPKFEKLRADLRGSYSRRISQKHRIVYKVYNCDKIVVICSIFSHYGE